MYRITTSTSRKNSTHYHNNTIRFDISSKDPKRISDEGESVGGEPHEGPGDVN